MAVDILSNRAVATVSSGGTDAPAAGTFESWDVSDLVGFPNVSSVTNPPTQFRVQDPAASTEIMLVTQVTNQVRPFPHTTWTVIRGAEGTIPVSHAPGFTVAAVRTAGAIMSAVDGAISAAAPPPLALFRGFISESGLDIAVDSTATIPMGGVALDTAGGSNGTGYTIPTGYGGFYELGFHVEMTITASGELYGYAQLEVNGTVELIGDWYTPGPPYAPTSGLAVFELAAGSVITVVVGVAGGSGPGNVIYDASRNYMTVVQLT